MEILAVGAHPDDIELGCGAALSAHRARGDHVSMLVLTRGEAGPQYVRSRIKEQEAAARILGATLYWGNFEDGNIPSDRSTVTLVEQVLTDVHADTVYVHVPRDSHQDHRNAAGAALAAARRTQRILLYESPSTIGFAPTLFIDIEGHLNAKLDALRAHESQVLKNELVDLEAVEAQARYRGFQARMSRAEAFEVTRMAWQLNANTFVDELEWAKLDSQELAAQ